MAQIIDSLPTKYSNRILCSYLNTTSRIQIARITNIVHWHLERAIFPGQHLLFEAVPDAQLEIHTSKVISAVLTDKITCARLRVDEGSGFSSNALNKGQS